MKRFVMRSGVPEGPTLLSRAERDGPEEFFLLQGNCQYEEAEKTGLGKFMQRSAGEWEMT